MQKMFEQIQTAKKNMKELNIHGLNIKIEQWLKNLVKLLEFRKKEESYAISWEIRLNFYE